jgi:hypothetical protein
MPKFIQKILNFLTKNRDLEKKEIDSIEESMQRLKTDANLLNNHKLAPRNPNFITLKK